ncbi:hypothetical protein A0H81_10519 [Grifola frondosa]|uniref:Uncharacterized protein n=1 Tax=Grifola frondosa TaxID=5627 RepID=A0A1C7LXX1_GRIFR|nr:hypothetical protein A0H81_10519 [Grifola frondosa]
MWFTVYYCSGGHVWPIFYLEAKLPSHISLPASRINVDDWMPSALRDLLELVLRLQLLCRFVVYKIDLHTIGSPLRLWNVAAKAAEGVAWRNIDGEIISVSVVHKLDDRVNCWVLQVSAVQSALYILDESYAKTNVAIIRDRVLPYNFDGEDYLYVVPIIASPVCAMSEYSAESYTRPIELGRMRFTSTCGCIQLDSEDPIAYALRLRLCQLNQIDHSRFPDYLYHGRMYLLNTKSVLLREFADPLTIPPYAILSHRWADPRRETTFEQLKARRVSEKIKYFCEEALIDGYDWVWVDTCCINKTSSSELSEAINSMYIWYGKSDVCYAYLKDVSGAGDARQPDSAFRKSEWFRRGWTLQELIAPAKVVFLDADWKLIGTKENLADVVEEITKVPRDILLHRSPFSKFSVAQRLSWAADRETTRDEDQAYSLMGLFGIHMPTLYGEGQHAFIRLQQEIMRNSNDHSVFAWKTGPLLPSWQGLLAPSPSYFHASDTIVQMPYETYGKQFAKISQPHYSVTNYGILLRLPLYHISKQGAEVYLAALACKFSEGRMICIRLQRLQGNLYTKESPDFIDVEIQPNRFVVQEVYIQHTSPVFDMTSSHHARSNMACTFFIDRTMLSTFKLKRGGLAPPRMWVEDEGGLRLTIDGFCERRYGTAIFEVEATGAMFAVILGADKVDSSGQNDATREVWVDLIARKDHQVWRDLSSTGGDAIKIQAMYRDPKSSLCASKVSDSQSRHRRESVEKDLGLDTVRLTTRLTQVAPEQSLWWNTVELYIQRISSPTTTVVDSSSIFEQPHDNTSLRQANIDSSPPSRSVDKSNTALPAYGDKSRTMTFLQAKTRACCVVRPRVSVCASLLIRWRVRSLSKLRTRYT